MEGSSAVAQGLKPVSQSDEIMILASSSDWTAPNVIQTLVAIGSLGAALAAGWAVRASNRVATATEGQADLARQELKQGEQQLELSRTSLQAGYRPVIVGVPHGRELTATTGRIMQPTSDPGQIVFTHWQDSGQQGPQYEHVRISVPVRNVGSGLAFIEQVFFQVQGKEVPGESSDILIAASERLKLTLELSSTHALFAFYKTGKAPIQLRLIYSDLSRKQLWENRFMFEHEQDKGYSVKSLIIDELPPKP